EEALEAVKNNKIDWRHCAVVETGTSKSAATPPALNGDRGASHGGMDADESGDFSKILDQGSDSLTILVNTKHSAWLVLNHTYFPGWQAEIDGKPTQIFPANLMFRAVQIPSGRHALGFYYRPTSFFAGIKLLNLALVISCGIILWSLAYAIKQN